jgi:hypothetical protein
MTEWFIADYDSTWAFLPSPIVSVCSRLGKNMAGPIAVKSSAVSTVAMGSFAAIE